MDKYRFSPIESEQKLVETIRYIADQASALSGKVIGTELAVSYVTVFSHHADEFENLKKMALELGDLEGEHNGPRVLLTNSIVVGDSKVLRLRIRHPDLERPQVGCADYDVPSYESFVDTHPASEYLQTIERPEFDMIEFKHPDFDVLGYVVSPNK